MDPLTAVGLAGNIIQFVDFSMKILSGSVQLYSSASGATEEHDELESLTRNLRDLANRTRYETPVLPRTNRSSLSAKSKEVLKSLSEECVKVADEMLDALDSIKVKGDRRAWKSVLQALRTVWREGHVNNLQRRLGRISRQLIDGMSMEQREEINRRLREMAMENTRLEGSRSQDIDQLKRDFNSALEDINRNVQEEGEMTRAWLMLSDTARRGQGYFAEQLILQRLRSLSIDHRHEMITREHSHTFSWIFDESSSDKSGVAPVKFTDWLKYEDGLYWVSGKPGSGKSTLMKFLATHETTQDFLNEWAGEKRLVVARFYFWNASTHHSEKSQEGLLRAILYQILRRCPELIQVAYHDQWVALTSDAMLLRETRDDLLTTPALLDAFRKLSTSIATTDIKFCFFIDGLDEYAGRPADIIKLVETLKSYENVKTCVSSRPWNEFEASFGNDNPWKLYMQDLTVGDIRLYVESMLGENARFRELRESDPQCPDFVQYIVSSAQGVFLWVFLVVRSLLDGLTNSDRIVDLQRRVEELPKDLEEYFEKILFGTDDRYRQQSAHAFTITMTAVEELPLMAYWIIDQEDPSFLTTTKLATPSLQTLESRFMQMERRLKALGKGLLERTTYLRYDDMTAEEKLLFSHSVGFLHRTVNDYFKTAVAGSMLREWSAPTFNPDLEICKAIGALIKMSPESSFKDEAEPAALILFGPFFDHAYRLDQGETHDQALITSILDELQTSLQPRLESCGKELYREGADQIRWYMPNVESKHQTLDPNLLFISMTIARGLTNYVAGKLTQQPQLCSTISHQFPSITVCMHGGFGPERGKVDMAMLRLVLKHGANPNKGFNSLSEWRIYLDWTVDRSPDKKLDYDCIAELLRYGADFEQKCQNLRATPEGTKSAADILRERFDAEQFRALQDIAERQKKRKKKSTAVKGVRMSLKRMSQRLRER